MVEVIKNIIVGFQREIGQIKVFKRELDIPVDIGVSKAITIYGPRRAGKTFYLFYLIKQYIEKKGRPKNIIYINFEDNRLVALTAEKLDTVTAAFWQLYPDEKPVFFLDEIQNINGWSKWVRKLVDQKYEVYVTGSNANLLSREIATELRGRTLSFMLLPLSFQEYLAYHNISLSDKVVYYLPDQNKIHALMHDYLQSGGFPETLELRHFRTELLLQEYLQSVIYQDIAQRYKLRNTLALKRMINFCLQNYASVFSVHKFYNDLKSQQIKIAKDTLYDYLEYLEEAVFVFQLSKHSPSRLKSEKELKKLYLCDLGYTSLFPQSSESGKRFENFVFLELFRIYGEKMGYFNEGFECDFVIGSKPDLLIQASYTLDRDTGTYDREIRSAMKAMKHYNMNRCYLVTFDESAEIKTDTGTIYVTNYLDFFRKMWKHGTVEPL